MNKKKEGEVYREREKQEEKRENKNQVDDPRGS
jgi:hypothetical protein